MRLVGKIKTYEIKPKKELENKEIVENDKVEKKTTKKLIKE